MKNWDQLTEDQKNEIIDEVASNCQDVYCCTRVWEAWNYGTMKKSNFHSADNDDEFLYDLAESVYNKIYNMKKK